MKSYGRYAWEGTKLGLALVLSLWNGQATLNAIAENSIFWSVAGLLATALCVQASIVYFQEIRRP